jgi:hypothetical protein
VNHATHREQSDRDRPDWAVSAGRGCAGTRIACCRAIRPASNVTPVPLIIRNPRAGSSENNRPQGTKKVPLPRCSSASPDLGPIFRISAVEVRGVMFRNRGGPHSVVAPGCRAGRSESLGLDTTGQRTPRQNHCRTTLSPPVRGVRQHATEPGAWRRFVALIGYLPSAARPC